MCEECNVEICKVHGTKWEDGSCGCFAANIK